MKTEQVEKLKNWFTTYVSGFYTGGADEFLDRHVRLKEDHTARVCEEMRFLTEALRLEAEDANLAQAAALLHDLGRFEQIRRYRTYVDPKSVNHCLLGVKILDQERILDGIATVEQTILRAAVQWHGARTLPEDLEERTGLFCRLIRDADKLDVLGLLIENFRRYYADPDHFDLEVEFPDEPRVSEHVLEAILNNHLVDYRQIRTLHDAQMVLLGWVFDMNFVPAIKKVLDRQYLHQIAAFLPRQPQIQQAVDHILRYTHSRIQSG